MADFRAQVEAIVNLSKAESDLNSFVNQSRQVKIDVDLQLNQASQSLANLLRQMQGQGSNAGSQFAGQFVQSFNSGVQNIDVSQVTNQIGKQTVKITNNIRNASRQLNQFNKTTAETFGNQMTAWARNNTRAVNAYGDRISDLQTRLRGAIANQDGAGVRQIREEFRLLQSEARATGNVGKTIGEQFSSAAGNVAKFAASFISIQTVFNTVRQGIQTVQQLDDALVDLQKTTTATPTQLNNFYKEANTIAKDYGTTTQQVIQSAADWSRLGYNLNDSKTMSKLSSQFAAISPGVEVEQATTGLVSIMKAFDIDASDALDGIMSKVNIIGRDIA